MTTDQSRHAREPIPTAGADILYTIRLHNIKEELFMEKNVCEFTMEEIYAAYLAASPEIQKEVRKLLGLES